MANEGRVRISLSTGELEVEGSAEFVATYDAAIKEMLSKLSEDRPFATPGATQYAPSQTAPPPAQAEAVGSETEKELGEVIGQLPNNATGTDQILVAAWFAAKDEPFVTGDASSKLVEVGVKLSNAAQSMKNNEKAKRVFRSGNKWRISRQGKDHLKSLGVL